MAETSMTLATFEERVSLGESVDAVVDGVAHVRFEGSTPVVCMAIHDGHAFRPSLVDRCRLDSDERRFEEDPFTGALVGAMPVTIIALDSRYEYDLNRPRAQAVYTRAWDKDVWKAKLSKAEIARSRQKHIRFYDIVNSLVSELELRFGACLIIDMHSYNHERKGESPPTFNLGTAQIDLDRWNPVLCRLERNLAKIVLPHIEVRIARDEVFEGRGYLASHITARFHDSLVIPLEVAKVFMDAETGEHFPMLLEELRLQMKHALTDTGSFFVKKHVRRSLRTGAFVIPTLDSTVLLVDKKLHKLARNVETLRYVNPINIAAEKRRFFAKRGEIIPEFKYRHLKIDPYKFREELYRLPIRKIRDPDIQALYRGIVDRLATRIELITTLGSKEFIYNSLRYYGEPNKQDLANARFLLHAPHIEMANTKPDLEPKEAAAFFRQRAEEWHMPVRVELSSRIVAKAMVESSRRALLVNRNTSFSLVDLEALSHHELGVHLVTTLNASAQPLRLFSLGLPGNTEAQEGLAVLCEYLSGNLPLERLRVLALRVLAVRDMTRSGDFRHTFALLRDAHGLSRELAFAITLRVYRGGGYTKDFLYLRGLGRALEARERGRLTPLLIGKVGFEQTDRIEDLMSRGTLNPLAYNAPAIMWPAESNPLIDYLLEGIRAREKNA